MNKSKKYNIILHTTTSCNYNCSYCDVIKDKKNLFLENIDEIITFVWINKNEINRLKFFWWEPLLSWNNIKLIINKTKDDIWNNFEIVTNTVLLNDEIWDYFSTYFSIIFFSIDSENEFDFKKVFDFLYKFKLKDKVYFNLIISPWKEKIAFNQFENLYKNWCKNFNILPVYFTKIWSKENLLILSNIMKKILDLSLLDKEIKLYWFQNNSWYNSSLINKSLFINSDLNIYYSDIIATKIWKKIKANLFLWNISSLLLKNLNLDSFKEALISFEKDIVKNINGQSELHKIMDYFSKYLNNKNGI